MPTTHGSGNYLVSVLIRRSRQGDQRKMLRPLRNDQRPPSSNCGPLAFLITVRHCLNKHLSAKARIETKRW